MSEITKCRVCEHPIHSSKQVMHSVQVFAFPVCSGCELDYYNGNIDIFWDR